MLISNKWSVIYMMQFYIHTIIMTLMVMKIWESFGKIFYYFLWTSEQDYHYDQLKLEKLLLDTLTINLVQFGIVCNFSFGHGMLHILYLIVHLKKFKTKSCLKFKGYGHSVHQRPSIKCSAYGEFWHYKYECPSKSSNTDILASKNLGNVITETKSSTKFVINQEIEDLIFLLELHSHVWRTWS